MKDILRKNNRNNPELYQFIIKRSDKLCKHNYIYSQIIQNTSLIFETKNIRRFKKKLICNKYVCAL